MSLLTVDVGGANETVVPFAKAGHAEPRQVGKRRYAFAGNERSMIRSEPMVIPLIGANLPAATVATLRSIFALGASVMCEGDVFNNGNALVLCSGEISDEMEVGGPYWIPTLSLTQVTAPSFGVFGLAVSVGGTSSGTTALINGPRYGTASAAGQATTSIVSPSVVRQLAVAAAGIATTSVRTTAQQLNVSASGVATVSITPIARTVSAAGRATVTITGSKIP